MNYDIFIDESGLFEIAPGDSDTANVQGSKSEGFDSQLAGFVAGEGSATRAKAQNSLMNACRLSGVTFEHTFHSTEIKRQNRSGFERLVIEIGTALSSLNAQPFRMVNRENLSFGDRKANYVNILAELLVRVCRKLGQSDPDQIGLFVYPARVRTGEDSAGVFEVWDREDYLPRIREVFARVAMANGWSSSAPKWEIKDLKLLSAKEDERLWICDAISNASHRDFKTISAESATVLRDSMGVYNWTLSFNETLQQVNAFEDSDALGLALITIVERSLAPWTSQEARDSYNVAATRIGSKLFGLPVEIQLPQLKMILGWLQQVSERRGDLEFAMDACRWIENYIIQKNSDLMDKAILSWFKLCVSTWGLTSCNHSGNTNDGRKYSERIQGLLPALAGCWEFAPDLMQALITQAVHFNDCFEHELSKRNMSLVSHYYQSLGGFFHEALPNIFPTEVQSDLCGKALGTQLQSEIFLVLAGKGDSVHARATSELAIRQFSLNDDRRRQFQYRSELEAVIGNWSEARSFLAKSLGINEDSHEAIAKKVADLEGISQGFAMLHWTRIGGIAASKLDTIEAKAFYDAFKSHKLSHTKWVVGDVFNYPVHGILRRLASVYALVGVYDKTQEALARLDNVVEAGPRLVFQMIRCAAKIQAAGLVGERDRRIVERILGGGKFGKSLLLQIKELRKQLDPNLEKHAEILTAWISALDVSDSRNLNFTNLVDTARVIGY
jgi:hypothetical protein